MLPLLAVVSMFLAPLALALHTADATHSALPAVAHHDAADHSTPPESVPHHDASHCAFCAAVHNSKHVLMSVALRLDLSDEAAPRFVVPPYLAPATAEPMLTLAIPRGPPVCG